ncbi:MAG: hypothetical protein M3Q80_01070 [bacterium]|nr:hypothetical protein [bacterium]
MQKMTFSIGVQALKEKMWEVLWSDTTFRDCVSVIVESNFMVGELKESNEVQSILLI